MTISLSPNSRKSTIASTKTSPMPSVRLLLNLPNEILFVIAEDLSIHDIGSLRITCRDLDSVFSPRIHDHLFSPRHEVPIIHWAAYRGYGELVKLALSKGIDIESRDHAERTALHFAANYADSSMVRLLLKNGADINAQDESGRTALFHAVCWRLKGTVQLLLSKGADASIKDKHGHNVLKWAGSLSMLWALDQGVMKQKLVTSLLFAPKEVCRRIYSGSLLPSK